jgi:hypothetical protein
MKKALVLLAGVVLLVFGPMAHAEDKGKEGGDSTQTVNKEIKEASKEVAKESKNIFKKTGRAGKSVWQGVKEGFKEAN